MVADSFRLGWRIGPPTDGVRHRRRPESLVRSQNTSLQASEEPRGRCRQCQLSSV